MWLLNQIYDAVRKVNPDAVLAYALSVSLLLKKTLRS